MLPALPGGRPRLTDAMAGPLDAVLATGGRLAPGSSGARMHLPPVQKAVVLLVDGLGTEPLAARAGHARTLSAASGPRQAAWTVFPSTTASALAALATGVGPAQHGLTGYTALDRENDRVVNGLTGWDDRMTPDAWQLAPTQFDRAADAGVPSFALGEPRFDGSGFTLAVLRGAEFQGAEDLAARFAKARELLDAHPRALLYVYTADVDRAGHGHGVASDEWIDALERTDAALAGFLPTLRADEGLIVTADHGMLDATERILIDEHPDLIAGVRHVAGEPRCLQLQVEQDADAGAVADRWRAAEGERAFVGTRDEVIAAGWFGDIVDPRALDRMGDVFVVARGRTVYYDARTASERSMQMVGQHGGISPAELSIPLLRFGAFAA